MATIKKVTKATTTPKKTEVIINTSAKKSVAKKSGVATADLKASHVTNVKGIDDKAKKTVIVKKDTVKIEPKVAEVKKEDSKKTTTKKATTTKKTTAKSTTTKTAAKKTTATKKTAAKETTTTKKAETVAISLHVQYAGKELTEQYITDRCIENYVAAGNKKTSIKTMETYVKVEDNTVYYVVNSTFRGHVVLD